jgi:hypothetical protein
MMVRLEIEDEEDGITIGHDGEIEIEEEVETESNPDVVPTTIEISDVGGEKINKQLEKLGLRNKWTDKMTPGDKQEYLKANALTRARMILDIKQGTPTKAVDKPEEKPTKKAQVKEGTGVRLDGPPPTSPQTTKKTLEKPAKTSPKPGINQKLKDAGLWRSGMQFLSGADKTSLLEAKKESERQEIFTMAEEKVKAIKAKQAAAALNKANAEKGNS